MKVNLIIVVSEFYESRKMSELAFRKMVWVCLFGLFMVMAWYLYYHRIPNIQTRTAREMARDSITESVGKEQRIRSRSRTM